VVTFVFSGHSIHHWFGCGFKKSEYMMANIFWLQFAAQLLHAMNQQLARNGLKNTISTDIWNVGN